MINKVRMIQEGNILQLTSRDRHLELLKEIKHLEIGSLVSAELLAPVDSEHLEHQELDQGMKRLVPSTPLHQEKAGLREDRCVMRRKKQESPPLGPLQPSTPRQILTGLPQR